MHKGMTALMKKYRWQVETINARLTEIDAQLQAIQQAIDEQQNKIQQCTATSKTIHPEQALATSGYIDKAYRRILELQEQRDNCVRQKTQLQQERVGLQQRIRILEKASNRLTQQSEQDRRRLEEKELEDLLIARSTSSTKC